MEKVFDRTNHKKMWQWLAENPGKDKDEWPEWEFNGGSVPGALNDCFACEYTKDLYSDPWGKTRYVPDCNLCPLVWLEEGEITQFMCEGEDSPYLLWMSFETEPCTYPEELTEKALEVKNLPVREGVKTK